MPTTSNFGWTTPADTDLVKDGAAAIRTLGNGIDASLVDLKGGTTGQILSKNSNTDLDYTWINNDQGDITEVQAGTGISVASGTGPVPVVTNTVATTFDAKGDLVVGTGADTFAKLTVGTNDYVLTAASGETTGLKWAAPSSGALTKISRASFSNVANTGTTFDGVFTSTYSTYLIVIESVYGTTNTDDLQLQYRYAGPTTQTASYLGNSINTIFNASSSTYISQSNTSEHSLYTSVGLVNYPSTAQILVTNVGDGSRRPTMYGIAQNGEGHYGPANFAGLLDSSREYTGFLLKSSSSNITGTVAVYGYQE